MAAIDVTTEARGVGSLLADAVAARRAAHEYFAIPLAELRVDTVVDFDLYIHTQLEQPPTLYREKNLPFGEAIRARLLETGVVALFVPYSQEDVYYRYMEKNIRAILADDSLGTLEKTEVLYDTAAHSVKDFLAEPESEALLPRTEELVSNLVGFLLDKEEAFTHFLAVGALDYKTYTHSVNVAMYSVTLAQRLGFTDDEYLRSFGMGCLLHDVGKSKVPQRVLNKKGALEPEEWSTIKQHPIWGYEILKNHGLDNEIVLDVTLDHHEKLDGSGYGRGLKGKNLAPHVRISTICDIFDALTTRRPYKGAMPSFEALRLMRQSMSGQLDHDFYETFVKMLSIDGQPGFEINR